MSFKDFMNEKVDASEANFKKAFDDFSKAGIALEKAWQHLNPNSPIHNNRALNDLIKKTFKHDVADAVYNIQSMNQIVKG
jgi:hypothetical protein